MIDDPQINAFILPGEFLYCYSGDFVDLPLLRRDRLSFFA